MVHRFLAHGRVIFREQEMVLLHKTKRSETTAPNHWRACVKLAFVCGSN